MARRHPMQYVFGQNGNQLLRNHQALALQDAAQPRESATVLALE
jgi:hypothetical protein